MIARQMSRKKFYNHLILSGTKILWVVGYNQMWFYNHLILSGTKIWVTSLWMIDMFYNHLILSGTKIGKRFRYIENSFTIT